MVPLTLVNNPLFSNIGHFHDYEPMHNRNMNVQIFFSNEVLNGPGFREFGI